MPAKKGFEWLGLDEDILKGVRKKGYTTPTPIQRKAIPLALDGRDVVAMARTGSGKTAAYLLPLFQHLLMHTDKIGIKGLILSPTRELAQQIWKFSKELSHFLPFKFVLLTGGDKIEKHFSLIHSSPDVIIATPGRLLHLLVEMELKLESVSYVVLDEADRLFELGFSEALNEMFARIPREKQLSLFSATLPEMVAEFATAKLNNPILIRLDLEHKLSPSLKLTNFLIRQEDKEAALLHLLSSVIPEDNLTAIFLPTRCHVEYFKDLLTEANLKCSYLYSSLDHTARKIQTALFFKKHTSYLLVTDIAARGIDIPWLDNVINFDLPPPKIFLHRVGRVARAGRVGNAYSLISKEEMAYLFDLTLFFGYPLRSVDNGKEEDEVLYIGEVPSSVFYPEIDKIKSIKMNNSDIGVLEEAMERAYKKYLQTKPLTNVESVRRSKEFIADNELQCHSLFADKKLEKSVVEFQKALRNFRPAMTVFEVQNTKGKKRTTLSASKVPNKRSADQRNVSEISSDFKEDTYLNYKSKDSFVNEQLSVKSSLRSNVVEMMRDENEHTIRPTGSKWDRKRKRFMNADSESKSKKVKSESGQWINATYKSDNYKRWLERNKVHSNDAHKLLSRPDQKHTKGKFTSKQPLAKKKPGIRKNIQKSANRQKSGKKLKKFRK